MSVDGLKKSAAEDVNERKLGKEVDAKKLQKEQPRDAAAEVGKEDLLGAS